MSRPNLSKNLGSEEILEIRKFALERAVSKCDQIDHALYHALDFEIFLVGYAKEEENKTKNNS